MRTGPPGELTAEDRVKMADRPQPLPSLDTRRGRTHNRSSSWSFTGRSGSTSDLGSLLTGSRSALRGILREVLPVAFTEQTNDEATPSTPTARTRGRTTIGQSVVALPSRVAATIAPSTPSRSGSLNLISEQAQEDRNSDSDGEERWPQPSEPIHITQGINQPPDGEIPEGEGDDVMRWLEQHALFLVIILVKIGWSYKFALSVLLGLAIAHIHVDRIIRREVAKSDNRSSLTLLYTMLFLCGNVGFIYYAMRESRLHYCLILNPPHVTPTLMNTIWCICVTDFMIRFSAMLLKTFVCLIFPCILRSRKKGKFYMLIESGCLFYRSIMAAPLWVRYLSTIYSDEESASHEDKTLAWLYAVVLTAIYLMIKGANLFVKLREFWNSFVAFCTEKIHGVKPSKQELTRVGSCAICQEDFKEPLMLPCHHIFCEECISMWFDREKTCPVCRHTVASNPKWRDGSTSALIQLF